MQLINRIQALWNTSGLALVDQAIMSGGNFLLAILFARFLGLEAYGQYALWWMIILFVLSMHQAAISKPLLTFLPQKKEAEKAAYLSGLSILQWLLCLLIALMVFLFLSIGQLFEELHITWSLALITSGLCLFHLSYDYYRKLLLSQSRLKEVLQMDIALQMVQLIALMLLVFTERLTLDNALLAILLANALLAPIMAWRYRGSKVSRAQLWEISQKHYQFAKWLLGTALLQWASGNLFVLAAGAILGAVAIGAIRMVQNIMGLLHVLFLTMENVIPVKAAAHYREAGFAGLSRYLITVSWQMGLGILLLLSFVALFAPYLIGFLYGEEYVAYAFVLLGYCLIYILIFIGHPLRFALRTLEDTRPIFVAYVLSAGFSLMAAYPMVRAWGLYGFMLGLFVTQLIAQLVYVYFLRKAYRYYENHPFGIG